MAYGTGILKDRIKVYNRTATKSSAFGSGSAGYTWTLQGEVWAQVTFSKGVKAMREGALDAYDVVMIRCRWNDFLTRNSRIECDGVTYQIDSYHADKMENTIQITATEVTA